MSTCFYTADDWEHQTLTSPKVAMSRNIRHYGSKVLGIPSYGLDSMAMSHVRLRRAGHWDIRKRRDMPRALAASTKVWELNSTGNLLGIRSIPRSKCAHER